MIIRFLLIAFALLFTIQIYAETWQNQDGTKTSSSPQALCEMILSSAYTEKKATLSSNPDVAYCGGKVDGTTYPNAISIYKVVSAECPASGQPRHFSFPAGTSVITQGCVPADGGGYCVYTGSGIPVLNVGGGNQGVTLYSKSATPASSCQPLYDGACDPNDPYGGCYTPPNDGCTRQPNGSIVCPDQTPPPTPDPKCNYNSTNSYCTPEGGQCPKGFVPGTANGQTICVKNSHDEPNCPKDSYGNYNCAGDPNQPPTSPPNNQQGDGSCNGTNNCSPNSNNTTNNTYNNTTNNNTTNNEAPKVDFSGVIQKLEEVKTGIAAVDSSVKGLATAVKAVEDAVNASSQKITDAVNAVKNKVTDVETSVKQNGVQAKADAEKQLKATQDQTAQDKQYQDWEKESRNCKLQGNGTYTTNGQAGTANAKVCEFADSFEDYKKWAQGKKEGTGIPEGSPDGQLNVRDTNLSDAGLTGSEMQTDYVKFSAACPADVQVPIHIGSINSQVVLTLKPACDLAPYFRAGLIAIAYLSGAFIVLGIGKSSGAGDA